MLDNLDGADPAKYIRSYWKSAHGLTNKKTLYRTISQRIKTPKAGKKLLSNLEAYAGKMQLYITALDEQVKLSDENPSIGIIICKNKDKTTV